MDALPKAIAAVLFSLAVILGLCFIVSDSTVPEESDAEPGPTYELVLDCSNAALMHRYGMPTKADCMQWHVHGQWGWITDGKLYAFDELPGDSRAWDELYGIDSDNKAFDK